MGHSGYITLPFPTIKIRRSKKLAANLPDESAGAKPASETKVISDVAASESITSYLYHPSFQSLTATSACLQSVKLITAMTAA
jgi:hypothetical protein